ncbi:MAG: hypothetical protein Q9163_004766 [Psora crenata]
MGEHAAMNMTTPSLQSKDHGELLDIIDLLRSQGISHYVRLPQLIVCGDQSSGKSSVLEAVSGVRFPTKENLCTRFATELVLRRDSTTAATVAIIPGTERTDEDREKLKRFKVPSVEIDEFPNLIEEAKEAMGLGSGANSFTNDVLRVELSGPEQPHLTLVDLPGLIHAESKHQSAEDVQLVSSLVRSYMANTRSIILAVVSAKNDYANQIVTKLARNVDPKGLRTLGIITKPDTLHAGSESEKAFLDLAQNKDVVFRLGWHVLKNRDYDGREWSMAERDENEREFFSRGSWVSMPTRTLGIGALKPRLSNVLKDQIISELPSLIRDVKAGIEDAQSTLARLGGARGSLQEQRLYLVHISQLFSSLVKAAVDGVYVHGFFGDAMTDLGFNKRLRAVVQDILLQFADDMRREGHSQEIVEGAPKPKRAGRPEQISRSDFLAHVSELMRRSRGRELPGTFNPLIIGDLFYAQSRPWKGFLERYSKRILDATRTSLELIMLKTTDENTGEGLLREVINPTMERYGQALEMKVAEVMEPHQKGHPITYNHYFTESIQKAREEHARKEQAQQLNAFFGKPDEKGSFQIKPTQGLSTENLLDALNKRTEADMDRYACSEAVDCMNAYYKVALKVIVDNFSVLGIEQCLLKGLSETFSPDAVMQFDDSLVKKIAAETEESQAERTRANTKLECLEAGLHALNRFNQSKIAANRFGEAFESPKKVHDGSDVEKSVNEPTEEAGDSKESASEASLNEAGADQFVMEVDEPRATELPREEDDISLAEPPHEHVEKPSAFSFSSYMESSKKKKKAKQTIWD